MAAGAAVNYAGVQLASLTVGAGGGAGNIINVESTAAGMTTTVNGGSGGSTINLSPTAHNLANLAGQVNINGEGGTNTLNAFDQATTLSQAALEDDLYQDHFTRSDPTQRTLFTYSGIQRVNVSAGRGDTNLEETFGVVSTPAGVPVTVTNAGTSTAAVEFFVGSPLDLIQGPLTIHGRAGGSDLLLLDDANNPNPQTFTLTGNTVSRTGMAQITYDNQNQLILYGGSGGNTFNVQGLLPGTTISLNGGSGNNTLVGQNTAGNLWSITGLNSGTVAVGHDYYDPALTFRDIQNLTGTSAVADAEQFWVYTGGSVGGNLLATSGKGYLAYRGSPYYAGSVVVDLQTHFATAVGGTVGGIWSVYGSPGANEPGLYNLLIGNGSCYLYGGVGRRNILVAGGTASSGASNLNGGGSSDEDLLIAGYTDYDTAAGMASWLEIATYWAGADDRATRAANLLAGNGVPLLDATTVHSNGGGNYLIGAGSWALIYGDGSDAIGGFDPNSIVVPITP
jgi:hypothetical protein